MFNLHIPSLNWLFDFEIILNIQVRNEKYLIKNQFDSSSKTSLLSIFALLFSYFLRTFQFSEDFSAGQKLVNNFSVANYFWSLEIKTVLF